MLESLSEYINANAPMTNLPELFKLHHDNPLGIHPIVIPILLFLLAVGMHITTHMINNKNRRNLYPLLYSMVGVAIVATYYYCFSSDLPNFFDPELHKYEICVGWFCQRSVVGIGWSILGEVLLTYTVFFFLSGLMQVVARVSDIIGMEEKQWKEWQTIVLVMLIGASFAAIIDELSSITGVWVMIGYQVLMVLMIIVKMIFDMIRTKNFGHSLLAALSAFVGLEAVTMLAIECLEGYVYIFVVVLSILASAKIRYRTKKYKQTHEN